MRFMMLMIPKGYESAEPGAMPDPQAVAAMSRYNQSLQEAGVLVSGAAYSWAKEQLFRDSTVEEMNAGVEASPVGARGVLTLPHFKGSAYQKGVTDPVTLAVGYRRLEDCA